MLDEDWGTEPRGNAGEIRLREVLKPRRTTIDYLYDFGDSWEHRLTASGIRAGEPGNAYPRFVTGERNAPPEDSSRRSPSTPLEPRSKPPINRKR